MKTVELVMSLLTAGSLDWVTFKSPFQPKPHDSSVF